MSLFARVGRLFRGFLSLFVSGLEESNPEALLEAARQDFREKMIRYNQALAQLAGIAERLKIQVKTKSQRLKDLETRIIANHKAGNLELAGTLARELADLKLDLTHDAEELKDTEEAYQVQVKNAKLAQKEFEEKIRKLERQLSQVKMKEAQAEATSALQGVAFKVGDAGDTLKGVDEILAKRYEKASGKVRVANDMTDVARIQEKEKETKALEQAALADFLASQGIQMEGPAGEAQVQRQIGPTETQAG
ncbi:MAG: PspA/IM30 family protein [Candidatus Eisenbacteria bacterium]|nr:PspA/IM30 family protein [Candidatus Eisenbacteria bacterium]MCC7143352.1 PspA/IM30 family protein [Candidatus Eisenbacteria bacterium]